MIRLFMHIRAQKKVIEYTQGNNTASQHSNQENALKLLEEYGITTVSSIFVAWLDTHNNKMGIRIPASSEIASLRFHAYSNPQKHYIYITDVDLLVLNQSALQRQENEAELPC